jgi:hypothetical protein
VRLPNGFKLDVGSSPRHERLTVEILYYGKYIATLLRETRDGPFELERDKESLPEFECERWPLDDFMTAIEAAKSQLAEG